MGEIFCTKCGAKLNEDAVFCTECGNKVDEAYSEAVEKVYEKSGNSYLQVRDKVSEGGSRLMGALDKSGGRIDKYRSHLPKGIINTSEDLIQTDLEFPDEVIDEKPVFEINGNRGTTLLVFEDRCVILSTSSIRSYVFRGGLRGVTAGEKEFYYKDVSSVQFKNLGKTNGYLMFEFAGSHSFSRATDDNSFLFAATYGTGKYKLLKEKMPLVYKYVKERIREAKQAPAPQVVETQTSDADELLKFKQLLDAGVITQEEFDAKKKQILGL